MTKKVRLVPSDVDCILEAVLMVSPNRQYLGIFDPTTPGRELGW